MVEETILKRRRSDRVYVGWPVSVRSKSNDQVRGEAIEVGDSGARIRFKDGKASQFSRNDTLRVTFETNSVRVRLKGKAVWFNQDSGGSTLGVAFEEITPAFRSRFQELLFLETGYVTNIGINFLNKNGNADAGQKHILDNVEAVFRVELPKFIKTMIQYEKAAASEGTYSVSLERSFIASSETFLKSLSGLEQVINDKVLRKNLKRGFRNAMANWAYRSDLVRRGYEKPLGYPGDYRMLEMIYDNKPVSREFGLYWDSYFLKDPYAEAVRNRKDMMKDILVDFLQARKKSGGKVLNLACGSCREIRELLSGEDINRILPLTTFTCVDQDEESIRFASSSLARIDNSESIVFVRENILNYIRFPARYLQGLGGQDMVYSIGLADYLPDRMLQRLIKFSYDILASDGQLVFAHKDCDTHEPLAPKWYCDWEFVPRNEEQFLQLLRDAGVKENVKVIREGTGHIFFTISRKS